MFRSLARKAMPLIKPGAKALGKNASDSGANLFGDVLAGKSKREAATT